ncbi:transcriptional regulatory protein ZraR [Clostridium homopropionicum DSM 5847]|uniref:Transcriptional regulatory protein ZraR n=1 Tax=Clostridium homopropionicum DSM 5847 TaxID=1121318 RepID=A0A0L6ZBU6_9CLOT|nr:sigma-54-dependent Fis family transcriptional regulator [Clostridium homopropionicum]KOA20445.1 transcriptional regulatory protein ZraR [Clostridium homopropionicum DSM 5847]SFG35153.1 PAS domain S-box-containing protein [Clostridium homopropionicum]
MNYLKSKAFLEFCYKIFDKLPVPIDIVDENGIIIYLNEIFADFFQMPQNEIIGKDILEVHPYSIFREVLKTKQAKIAAKHKFKNKADEAIVHIIPLLDDDGEVLGGIGMVLFEDVDKMENTMLKFKTLDKEIKLLKNEIAKMNRAKYNLDSIVGISEEINECKDKIRKVVKVNSNILLVGESGVGKELFAHSIHNESDRRDMPFVVLNCSAIPENLIESELFGYEEGSFTGAKKGGNIGKFELANGGTIFLDEIGEMPIYLQAKLLRVLQEKEVHRIGGKKPIKLDVRVISATNRDLKQMIREGKFREDLYYRLNVISIEIPPLRKRIKDIPLLIKNFVDDFHRETGLYRKIGNEVMDVFIGYNWPGNIRELKNIIEKICVIADDVNVSIKDIPKYIVNSSLKKKWENQNTGLNNIMKSIEKEIILNTLKQCKGNKRKTAMVLEIPRSKLYRKLDEYNIEEGNDADD